MKLYISKKNTLLTLALSLSLIQPQAHAISLNSLGATLSQNKTAACLIGGLVVASTALGFYAYKKTCALQAKEQEIGKLNQEKAGLESTIKTREEAHAQAIEYWKKSYNDVDQRRQSRIRSLRDIIHQSQKLIDQSEQAHKASQEALSLTQTNLAQAKSEIATLGAQLVQAQAKNGQLAKSLETASVIKQAIELIERHNKNLKDLSPKKLHDTKKAIEQELQEIDALIAQTQALAGNTINTHASSGADIKHSAEAHAIISAAKTPVVAVITRLQEHKEKILKLQKIILAEERTIEAEQAQEQAEKQVREKEDKDRQDAALQLTASRKAYQERKAREEQARVAQEKQAKNAAIKEQARKAIPAYQHRVGDTGAITKPIPTQQKMKLKRTVQMLKSQDAGAENQKNASNGSAATTLSTWLWSWFNVTGKNNN